MALSRTLAKTVEFLDRKDNLIKRVCYILVVDHNFQRQEPELFARLWDSARGMCDLLRHARVQDVFNRYSKVMMLVTCDRMEVVALAQFSVEASVAELDLLCTYPKALRGQVPGVGKPDLGRLIVGELEDYLIGKGVTTLNLMSVLESMGFYRRLGFVAERPDYPTYLSKTFIAD